MHVSKLSFQNFRNLDSGEVSFVESGIVLITGENGQGKSNLLEAVGTLGNSKSFRKASPESMVRFGEESAFLRGDSVNSGRELLVEMEISPGKSRTFVNKQRQTRTRRLEDLVPTTSFSPTDLDFVKGPPQLRRELVDDLLGTVSERFRSVESDFQRALKQRNSLLKQCRGRLSAEAEVTLDVWDERLSEAAEKVGNHRADLIEKLTPGIESTYRRIAGVGNVRLVMQMISPWRAAEGGAGMHAALQSSRTDDLRREVTTVGPHRDDMSIHLNGMPARSHASQGEQRSVAVATKLAAHTYCRESWGGAPILLLDDVFSELDELRVERFLDELPTGQIFIASASGHSKVRPDQQIRLESGKVIG